MTDKTKNTWFYYGRIKRNIFTGFKTNRKFSETWDYDRGSDPVPVVTVCLKYDPESGTYSRGVAVCSIKDKFVKRMGRTKAEAFARREATAPCNSGYLEYVLSKIEDETGAVVRSTSGKVYFKGRVNIHKEDLSDFERRVVEC